MSLDSSQNLLILLTIKVLFPGELEIKNASYPTKLNLELLRCFPAALNSLCGLRLHLLTTA
jgi:hypothetical protein